VSSSRKRIWIKLSGYSAVATPLVAFAFILSAIALAPRFSWTNNALSDLGVMTWPTDIIFNTGLIISGILSILFATGLYFSFNKGVVGRSGATIFLFCAVALTTIGVFSENMKPMHIYASVAFFGLFPIAMFVLTASYFRLGKPRRAFFTLAVALFAALVWVLEFLFKYVPGVAIPETLSALAASLWAVVIGFSLTRSGK
jgi:hypothetical membrane protein